MERAVKTFTNIPKLNKRTIEELYLEYFNDFITVARFAEYNGFTLEKANRIIVIGRKINQKERG